jgi:hypothetical protein
LEEYKLDKTAFEIRNLHDDCSDKQFWLSKTPQERISEIENLRKINYGQDAAESRLQGFFEVIERP